MDDLDKDLVLQWYDSLESQLLEVMRYVPPAPENLTNYSPQLASIVVDACGLLDSILRQVSPDPATISGKSKARRKLDIEDYANLYASKFALPDLKSILLLSPPRYASPFAPWAPLVAGNKYAPTAWWSTHTDLKHDWIANLKKAQLEIAIESLCALHQVIAVVPDLGKAIMRRGWIPGRNLNPEIVVEILGWKTTPTNAIMIETKLFATARGKTTLPADINDFHPAYITGGQSQRLVDFFGRW
jgi:hypothetical protein